MCVNFVLLAQSTAFHVVADEGGESGPPKFSGDQLACFQEAGMTGGLMVMAAFEDGVAEGVVCRDVDAALVGKDAGFDLPVSELRAEWERDIFVHGLEGLEDKGVTCRSGFDPKERAVSIKLTKRDGGRRVTLVLSESSAGRRSGRRERASGPARSFPGTWTILRSKSARSMSQRAWRWFSAWGWRK